MELRHLRYFIAVAENLSFRHAAQRLHITVPPLSRQILELEEELQAKLLTRDRRGVALTEAGELLLKESRALLAQLARTCDSVRRVHRGASGLVRIGIALGLADNVSRVIVEHAHRFPAVEIQCSDIASTAQNRALIEGTIDVGFVRPPVDTAHLVSEFLFEERLLVLISETSALAKRRPRRVRLAELAEYRLLLPDRNTSVGLHDKVLELYRRAGVTPKGLQEVPFGDTQETLLKSGWGVGVVGSGVRSRYHNVVAIPLDEADATMPVHVAWRKSERSAAVLNFLECVRSVLGRREIR